MPESPSSRCVLLGLEKQRLQLQHVGRAVGQGERKASLAQELVLLELVPQVLHAHHVQVGVVLGERQCVDGMRARSVAFAARFARFAASWPCASPAAPMKPAAVRFSSMVTLRPCPALFLRSSFHSSSPSARLRIQAAVPSA
eukprot:5692851-Pleurochrysis_carterae.AAC.6